MDFNFLNTQRSQNYTRRSYTPPTAFRPARVTIPVSKKVSAPVTSWHVGEQVNHRKWGLGTVMDVDAKKITISFANPEVGVKVLGLKVAPIDKV